MPRKRKKQQYSPEFIAAMFPRQDDTRKPLGGNVQVRLTKDIDAIVQKIPNRSAWLRRVISEAALREFGE